LPIGWRRPGQRRVLKGKRCEKGFVGKALVR
jgi:hypothetical protein